MENVKRENLKLVSVRIDPETLKRLDEFVERHVYWKRNQVINHILWAVVHDFMAEDVYDMMRRTWFKNESVNAKYEIQR